MSIWDLRQMIEARIPWWAPFAFIAAAVACTVVAGIWNSRKR